MPKPRPPLGFTVIPKEKIPNWIPLLHRIYEFESLRVAGPSSSQRDLRTVLWSKAELSAALAIPDTERQDLDDLMGYLEKTRQLMRVPGEKEAPERFVTRVAETIRILGHSYEYWYKGRPGIDTVRWLVEEKKVPRRNLSLAQVKTALNKAIASEANNRGSSPNLNESIERVLNGIAERLGGLEAAGFSQFQLDTIAASLESRNVRPGSLQKATVLTAGVGSGKTLAFGTGALIAALEGQLGGRETRRSYLLVYPRKALAFDQARVLGDYAEAIGMPALHVHLEHERRYREEGLTVAEGIEKYYTGGEPFPSIVITTFETLRRRLSNPRFAKFINRWLAGIILDEIHLAAGLTGGHIAMLVRRLRQTADGRNLLLIGASATVARPDEHAARIFGLNHRDVEVISPSTSDLDSLGLAHHVFLRSSGLISPQGALVNATSLLVHSRRHALGTRARGDEVRQKSIAFADNLDMLGRWNADLRENERTEDSEFRRHPTSPKMTTMWSERQRELPYALRFQRPLQRRIEAEGGAGEALDPVLPEERGKDWCNRCQNGERLVIASAVSKTEVGKFSQLVHRHPHRKDDSLRIFHLQNPVFAEDNVDIGTMDRCPYLRAGACLWFPMGEPGPAIDGEPHQPLPLDPEPIPEKHPSNYEWREVVRSIVYSSKSEPSDDAAGDDLAEIVYRAPANRVYGVRSDQPMSVDIVLASPSLEVGVDLPMLTEGIMTKAIRNIASYRQKAGRVGREPGMDVMNVTFVHDTAIDLHYYRQPTRLVSRGRLDPISLKDRNEAILYSGLYSAVWDWLALRSNLPEPIPRRVEPDGKSRFSLMLGECLHDLQNPAFRARTIGHLRSVALGIPGVDPSELEAAVGQVESELRLLLTDSSSTLTVSGGPPAPTVADIFAYLNAESGPGGRDVRAIHGRELGAFSKAAADATALAARIQTPGSEGIDGLRRLGVMDRTGCWDLGAVSGIVRDLGNEVSRADPSARDANLVELHGTILPRLERELKGLCDKGHHPIVYALYSQYRELAQRTDSRPTRKYLYMLMPALRAFETIRLKPWFVRPETLFSNPFEPRVDVVVDGRGLRETISVSEALFSALPGVWTYRLPEACYKVRSGALTPMTGGRLVGRLNVIEAAGSRFQRVIAGLPPPPGVERSIDVYRPTSLALRVESRKYPIMDRARGLILDGDEALRATPDSVPSQVKVPKSFANRWVHIEHKTSESVLPLSPETGRLVVEGDQEVSGSVALSRLRHPLFGDLLSGAFWHDELAVTEYVFALSRSYSGGGGEGWTLSYQDQFDVDVGFGDSIRTEGLSIELNPETLGSVVEAVSSALLRAEPIWQPSLLKAFKAYLEQIPSAAGGSLLSNPFIATEVVALLMGRLSADRSEVGHDSLIGLVIEMGADPSLMDQATEYYRRKNFRVSLDPEAFGGPPPETEDQFVIQRAGALTMVIRALAEVLRTDPDPASRFATSLPVWVRRTILNTLGLIGYSALQEYSGASDHDVGYAVAPDAWSGSSSRVYFYDRAPFGNGSSDVARRFLHIPHVLRHGLDTGSRLLPTEDFLSHLEEGLLQCPQMHSDLSALTMHSQLLAGELPSGIQGLQDVAGDAHEVFDVSRPVWDALGIRGPEDGWKLPIAACHLDDFLRPGGPSRDDFIRGTTVCWTGCPECVERTDVAMGGMAGRNYLDKMILDAWFEHGVGHTSEYVALDLRTLAGGTGWPAFGALHRVRLDLPDRTIRSAQLPWTIGFALDRGAAAPVTTLLIRNSDFLDMRLDPTAVQGVAPAVESVGFKRLLWFDLLVTSFLNSLDLVPPERKEIRLVYYDCRDFDFDDLGLTPRMTESVRAASKRAGQLSELEMLSDILAWLAKQGFELHLCVDGGQAVELPVAEFLQSLRRSAGPKLHVVTKHVEGSMHKKLLLTPLAVLSGSANLTRSGTGRNEETISHSFFGTAEYRALRQSVLDSFRQGEPWNG
ncbi:MAG: DEAD/DEAH box helicase [Thermoplasmata archaeon]|nr:DEAD/DEAH box helicase [Thermoplasmata archaeon]